MLEIGTSGLMSGEGRRGDAEWPKPPRPSSTLQAINHDTGELIDWECGDRSEKTAALLIERLNKIGAKLYVADEYVVYANLIPIGQLYQGKDLTHGIERNNCRQRHWFARFRRKSIVVSKAKWMVDVTMALFARFRVNGTLEDLLQFVPLGKPVWVA